MKKRLLFILSAVYSTTGFTQQVQRCSSMEYLHMLEAADPSLSMRRAQQEVATAQWVNAQQTGRQQTIVQIPVVFHILYNDSTQNLSDDVVLSQMEAINEDYSRMNSDTGQTPLAFRAVAADCEIQFCLAQRTPSGQSTNGIIHKFTTVTAFDDYEKTKFNQFGGDDVWDASKYMNVWVAAFQNSNFLGIGTFPNSVPASSDGIVINYKACGRIGDHLMDHYNKGRSLTHEIGHYLNLLHVWGDDGYWCSSDDFILDTPLQTGETYGCPAYPRTDSCTSTFPGVMFMNYMDYTDDECMNIFTEGQKMRMLAALNIDRVSLLTSDGCLSVGISENEIRKAVSVYPNPATAAIKLKSEKIQINGFEIQNMIGETMLAIFDTQLPYNERTIDISAFSQGIYLLKIHTEIGNTVYKIVKR